MPWILPPFYVAPTPVRELSNTPEDPIPTLVISVESYLQQILQSDLSDPENFTNPNWPSWVSDDKTEQGWIQSYIASAADRIARYPMLGVGIKAKKLGEKYGATLVNKLMEIDSGPYGGKPDVSLWDFWLALGKA